MPQTKNPQYITVLCPICKQGKSFAGKDKIERAEMWMEDGNHHYIDLLEQDEEER